ncbi:MAG: DUF3500 domain-containing protein [Chloroflexi bacterium]|nr:DUF3500 domain-containing protein [Chloroflexota bacterium]MCI0810102.1 DUF3500 domain-containing protein [Chloroflexota bacterium]MCI0848686.1 DUF3500 domain-containing protein [Chloroflexota bacterium]MCI0901877.1 DUF3500 domain-containing protein [Chloroflexota bacterium]
MATQQTATPQAVGQITDAAKAFVNSLNAEQKAKALFEYMDGERVFWYYPPMNRHGLALRDMEPAQRELAMAVLASGLTPESYEQAKLIIEHEEVLGPLEKEKGIVSFRRDVELYYFTIFGEPGGKDPWGWRVEGHHISIHFSIMDDKVISTTPFFFGVNPAEVRKGPKNGLRILGGREDLAFDLMNSLDEKQVEESIICETAPADIVTFNASKASLMTYEGLPASKMNGAQKELLMALVSEYVNQVRSDLAGQKLADLEKTGLDHLHFAWAGPVSKDEPHYYRIHGGDFVVEFDNRQDGANHIHSVWRDVENDFAADVLRDHLILYHVL